MFFEFIVQKNREKHQKKWENFEKFTVNSRLQVESLTARAAERPLERLPPLARLGNRSSGFVLVKKKKIWLTFMDRGGNFYACSGMTFLSLISPVLP